MAMAGPIEDLNVEITGAVSSDPAKAYHAVINDPVARRAWSGAGATQSEAATAATQKFLRDRRAREYVGG